MSYKLRWKLKNLNVILFDIKMPIVFHEPSMTRIKLPSLCTSEEEGYLNVLAEKMIRYSTEITKHPI